MAARKRLTREQEDRVIEAYEAWDPRDRPIDDVASDLGVSRQTIYRVVERRGILKKSQTMGIDPATGVPDDLTLAMSRQALTVLIDELVSARQKLDDLEAENARLRALTDGAAKRRPSSRSGRP